MIHFLNKRYNNVNEIITKDEIIMPYNNADYIALEVYYNTYLSKLKNLSIINIIINTPNYYYHLFDDFFNSFAYKDYISKYNASLNKFKNILSNLKGFIIYQDKRIDINNIESLWIFYRTQFFLKINNILIESSALYFNGRKEDTELINQLGFLNKFQYDIIYGNNFHPYLNYLKLNFQYNSRQLNLPNIEDFLFKHIENYNSIDINIIKQYWLLPKFTKRHLSKIKSLHAKRLLNEL